MLSNCQNKIQNTERIREDIAEAFRLWHEGKSLTDAQQRLIREASVDHNLRAFTKYLDR